MYAHGIWRKKYSKFISTICYSKAIYLTQSSRRHSTHQCFDASLKIQQNNESITTCWKQARMWHDSACYYSQNKHILLSKGERKTYIKSGFWNCRRNNLFLSKLSQKRLGVFFSNVRQFCEFFLEWPISTTHSNIIFISLWKIHAMCHLNNFFHQ